MEKVPQNGGQKKSPLSRTVDKNSFWEYLQHLYQRHISTPARIMVANNAAFRATVRTAIFTDIAPIKVPNNKTPHEIKNIICSFFCEGV